MILFIGAQALEIERILAASTEEERRMKEFQIEQMKKSWADNAARKAAEKAASQVPDFDMNRAGPASLQHMAGYDDGREKRLAQQKEQMKAWIQEQIAQKEYVKALDHEDDLNYADMIKAIDEIRDATEREEQEMRKYVINTVKAQNLEVFSCCCAYLSSYLRRVLSLQVSLLLYIACYGPENAKTCTKQHQWREQRGAGYFPELLQRKPKCCHG
jgi:hypothetical protein